MKAKKACDAGSKHSSFTGADASAKSCGAENVKNQFARVFRSTAFWKKSEDSIPQRAVGQKM